MNERKSWRWVAGAYGGVVALVAVVTVFVMRGTSHEGVVVMSNGAATPTPTVVDVFHGIRSDPMSPWIHAKFHVCRITQEIPRASPVFGYRPFTFCGATFHPLHLTFEVP